MNLPQAYLERMKGQLGEAFDAYLRAMDQPEKRAARANGLKLTAAAIAVKSGTAPRGVAMAELVASLKKDGVWLG